MLIKSWISFICMYKHIAFNNDEVLLPVGEDKDTVKTGEGMHVSKREKQ